MKRHFIRVFALTVGILCLLMHMSYNSHAQPSNLSGRLVYVRTLADGSSELVSRYPEGSVTLPIGSTEYYTFSPNGLYVAISDMETPTDIRVYRTDTARLALQQPWLPQWHAPSNFDWANDSLLNIYRGDPTPPPNPEYDELDVTTNTLTARPYPPEPALPNLPRLLASDPNLSTIPGIPLYLPSSQVGMYAYVRCVNGEPIADVCPGADQETVIFDAAQGRTLVTLVDPGVFLDYAKLRNQLTWSPSGRYLIYLVNSGSPWVNMYDTVSEQYENTDKINATVFYPDIASSFYWSHNETLIAKWIREPYQREFHLGFIDRMGNNLSIASQTFQVYNRALIWSPDDQAVAFAESNGDLQVVDSAGNVITVAHEVSRVITWDFPPPPSDLITGAIELPDAPGSVSADTVALATVSATDPIPCATERTNTVWYRYTPGSDGWLRVSTFGSSYDTVIAAYTGTEGALTEVACNDDAPGTTASSIRFAVTSETPVYIMVANKGTTPLSGSHTLRLGYEPIYSDFIGVYNPPLAQWYLRSALSAGSPDYAPQFGFDNSQPVVCDWNGNGTDTIGVFNPANGELFLRDRNDGGGTSYPVFSYGTGGKILCGDWDGDGFDTIGVYYPASAMFHLRNSLDAGSPDYSFQYGFDGTLPVAGDWDGDGRDGIGIYDLATGNWYLRNALSSGAADYQFAYGSSNRQPIAADWDGDGRDGIGVYDVSSGNWYLRNALSSGGEDYPVFAYGGFGFSVAGTWNLPGQIGVFMREGVPQIEGARYSDGAPLPPFTGDWDAIQRDNALTPTPTPAPTSTPVPAGVFYRAINLGGRSTTIGGHAWEGRNARDFTSNGQTGSNTRISLNPTTDRTRTDMIQSYVEHWAHEITLSNMPSGSYNVYLYAWQDWGDPIAEPFSVALEGQIAESGIRLTGVGVWRKLGPWTVEVTDGTLNLTTSGYIPKLSGLEVWQLP
ncbi:MAG: hypothetical protein KJ065_24500 [Anaerolineae bacterium]|nr:hypothetical protein [Anaerolineae bacterium]